jgi:hypothetical protein
MFQQMIWLEAEKWERYQEMEYLLKYLYHCKESERRQYLATHNLELQALENRLTLSEIGNDKHLTQLYQTNQQKHLTQEDMVARYLKFLIQTSIDNNSFYLALAINHMVYDYIYIIPGGLFLCPT